MFEHSLDVHNAHAPYPLVLSPSQCAAPQHSIHRSSASTRSFSNSLVTKICISYCCTALARHCMLSAGYVFSSCCMCAICCYVIGRCSPLHVVTHSSFFFGDLNCYALNLLLLIYCLIAAFLFTFGCHIPRCLCYQCAWATAPLISALLTTSLVRGHAASRSTCIE